MAESKEAHIQNTMVYPMEPNICPLIPFKNTKGINTTQVVMVDPIMDWITILVPSRDALAYSRAPFPPALSMALKQLSRTTMELSTIMPTPSTSPLMVIMFREKPICVMTIRDMRIEVGIELPTIREAFMSPKNTKMMAMEINTAKTMVTATSFRELKILSASSRTIRICKSPSSSSRDETTAKTSWERDMAVASCCLVIDKEMVSSPLYRETPPLCSSV